MQFLINTPLFSEILQIDFCDSFEEFSTSYLLVKNLNYIFKNNTEELDIVLASIVSLTKDKKDPIEFFLFTFKCIEDFFSKYVSNIVPFTSHFYGKLVFTKICQNLNHVKKQIR